MGGGEPRVWGAGVYKHHVWPGAPLTDTMSNRSPGPPALELGLKTKRECFFLAQCEIYETKLCL